MYFRVFPFGLTSACYVFTKFLQPLVKHWRSLGIRAVVYIDDSIVASKSETQCLEHEKIVLSDLRGRFHFEHQQMLPKASSNWRLAGFCEFCH